MSGDAPVPWHPSQLFRQRASSDGSGETRFALIILDQPQPLELTKTAIELWDNALFRVAADGGANRLHDATKPASSTDVNDRMSSGDARVPNHHVAPHKLDLVIGDFDSLRDDVRTYWADHGTEIIHDEDQYSTDFTKAARHIKKAHPGTDIVALGGLGGRVDQGLSQLHHICLFQQDRAYAGGRMFHVTESNVSFLLKTGKHRIRVREAGVPPVFAMHVGIIPITGPSRITTRGLKWDVDDWPTEFGGQMSTSNHLLEDVDVVEVETTADVLFTVELVKG